MTLTRDTTVRQWLDACDIAPPTFPADQPNRFWRTGLSDDPWRAGCSLLMSAAALRLLAMAVTFGDVRTFRDLSVAVAAAGGTTAGGVGSRP